MENRDYFLCRKLDSIGRPERKSGQIYSSQNPKEAQYTDV